MAILPDSLEMRPIIPPEVPAFAGLVERTFGGARLTDAEIINRRGVLEPPRTLAVFDQAELIATLATHSLTMSVPGGELPVGGVNHVAVRADYRRRGLMTAMMMAALRDIRDRGEVVSALWPSEAQIYGRFGYGLASRHASLLIDGQPGTAGSLAPGEIRLIPDASTADTALLDRIYRSWHATRPGSIARSAERWRQRLLPRDDGRGAPRTWCASCITTERRPTATPFTRRGHSGHKGSCRRARRWWWRFAPRPAARSPHCGTTCCRST